MLAFAIRAYKILIRFGVYLAPIVLLVIRLAWGWELFESGRGHLNDVAEMTKRFTDWGVPFPHINVYISASTEMVGGILIMFGFASRLISIPLFFNFCVAYLTASRSEIVNFFHQDPSNFIDDSAFPFLIMTLIILAFGPGIFSIDGILRHTVFRRTKTGVSLQQQAQS